MKIVAEQLTVGRENCFRSERRLRRILVRVVFFITANLGHSADKILVIRTANQQQRGATIQTGGDAWPGKILFAYGYTVIVHVNTFTVPPDGVMTPFTRARPVIAVKVKHFRSDPDISHQGVMTG